MKWIDSSNIKNWAADRDAQAVLPLLIRKLISASVNVKEIDIPAGSAVSTSGWDGIVVADNEHQYVPTGQSVWEFGVDSDAKSKANSDYEKRAKNTLGIDPQSTHYRFVSPRAFTKNKEWAKEKSHEKFWLSVKAYNASDLESWLNNCPSVAKWFSSKIGLHSSDNIEALDMWWEKWSTATTPNISETMLLIGRENEIDKFKKLIEDKSFLFSIEADSLDEGLAFIYSAAKSFNISTRENFLSRALIIETKSEYENIVENYSNIILIPIFQEFEGGNYARSKGHSVVVPIGRSKNFKGDSINLIRQDKSSFSKALEDLGIERAKAWQLAGDSKRSLTVYRRLKANGQFSRPGWLSDDNRDLVPMLLLGAFDSKNEIDKAVACEIFHKSYNEIEVLLSRFSQGGDPYVRKIFGVWELISFRDAWHFLSHEITDEIKNDYRKVFLDVYSDENTKFKKGIEDRFFVFSNDQYKYSHYLRNALKQTFVLLAVDYGNQSYVDSILKELLNENTSWELWASLMSEMSDFAEASPNVFLCALSYLTNQNDKVQKLFEEPSNAIFGGHSFTGILWGLERLIWINEYSEQAVLILSKLAKLDTNKVSNYCNRPINCLKEIFLFWHPQGNFSMNERLELINKIHTIDNGIAWSLIQKILPKRIGGTASGIQQPTWREYKRNEAITYGEAHAFVNGLITLALKFLKSVESINIVIDQADRVTNDTFSKLINSIIKLNKNNYTLAERKSIWDFIEEMIARCEKSENDLIRQRTIKLNELAELFKPDDPAYANAYLFDYDYNAKERQYPDIKNWKEYDEELKADRLKALIEIHKQDGIDGLTRLISISKDPRSIGQIAGENVYFHNDLDDYFLSNSNSLTQNHKVLYEMYIRVRSWHENNYLADIFKNDSITNEMKAEILLWCPGLDKLFDYLSQLNPASAAMFWEKVYPYYLNEEIDQNVVIEKYLSVGNAFFALEYAAGVKRTENIESYLLVKILFALLTVPPKRQVDNMGRYYIDEVFKKLWQSPDVSENDLLKLEWAYLRLWDGYDGIFPKTINRKIATDPIFFADLLNFAFRPKNNVTNNINVAPAQSENAYDALEIWNVIPGQNEDRVIDFDKLMKWINEARDICNTNDRLEICDQYIGHILAKSSKVKEYQIPDEAILKILDNGISENINIGFDVQFHNNRGACLVDQQNPENNSRNIATKCRSIAQKIVMEYPRASELYAYIAQSYESTAKYDSERHELDGF